MSVSPNARQSEHPHMNLIAGYVYKRSDLHAYFGGQRQGGISTPTNHRVIFLFTGDTGEQYGYRDGFQEDGTFWYTGEGQSGNMEFVRGNKAILEAQAAGKTIHLFETSQRAYVRYLGEVSYLGHHVALGPDINGQERRLIIFELSLVGEQTQDTAPPDVTGSSPSKLWQLSLSKVREAALASVPTRAAPKERRVNSYIRSQAIKVYVLRRAAGICEGCGQSAPFTNRQGHPYLEPHHIDRLADGGPDHPAHVAALCPNCHRRVHYGHDGDAYNKTIAVSIQAKEATLP